MRPYRLIFYFFKCYLDGVQYPSPMQTDTNQAVAKLSPLLPLTPEQEHLVHQILKFTNQHLTGPAPAVLPFTVKPVPVKAWSYPTSLMSSR